MGWNLGHWDFKILILLLPRTSVFHKQILLLCMISSMFWQINLYCNYMYNVLHHNEKIYGHWLYWFVWLVIVSYLYYMPCMSWYMPSNYRERLPKKEAMYYMNKLRNSRVPTNIVHCSHQKLSFHTVTNWHLAGMAISDCTKLVNFFSSRCEQWTRWFLPCLSSVSAAFVTKSWSL